MRAHFELKLSFGERVMCMCGERGEERSNYPKKHFDFNYQALFGVFVIVVQNAFQKCFLLENAS